jgi:hypothetical protein
VRSPSPWVSLIKMEFLGSRVGIGPNVVTVPRQALQSARQINTEVEVEELEEVDVVEVLC